MEFIYFQDSWKLGYVQRDKPTLLLHSLFNRQLHLNLILISHINMYMYLYQQYLVH